MEKKSLASSTILILILTFIGYVVSLTTQVLIANYFGTSAVLDAFVIASIIPNIFYGTMSAIFFTLLIIVVTEYMHKEKDISILLKPLSTIIIMILIIITGIIIVLAPYMARLLGSNFDIETIKTTSNLIRVLTLASFFLGLTTITTAILHIKKKFFTPALLRIFLGVGIVFTILLFVDEFGIYTLAAGTLLGAVLAFILQLFELKKEINWLDLAWEWSNPYIKHLFVLAIPLVIYTVFFYLNKSLNSILAAGLPAGNIAILNYAFILISFPVILLSGSLAITLFPTLRESVVLNKNISDIVTKAFSVMIYLFIPITALFFLFGKNIVQILFERGAFTAETTMFVTNAVLFYSVGLVAYGVHSIIIKILYSLKKLNAQTYLMILLFAANLVLSIIFMQFLKANGLALGFAVSHWFVVCIGILYINKKIDLSLRVLLGKALKTSVATTGLIITAMILFFFIDINQESLILKIFMICFIAGCSVVMFIIMSIILRISELDLLIEKAKCVIK